jgi:hypothetical protein
MALDLASATSADLKAALEQARNREAAAAKVAAENAQQAAAAADRAERAGRRQLQALRGELAEVLAHVPDDRPAPDLRVKARLFLYGAYGTSAHATAAEVLLDMTDRDPTTGRLHSLLMTAGQLVATVPEEADDLECRAWAALMGRVRWLAGEGSR